MAFRRSRNTVRLNRKKSYKSRVKKAVRNVKKRSMVSLIKSVVNKQAQTKYCNTLSTATFFNSGIDSVGEMYPLIPQCSVGYQNDKSRVGNEIRVSYLKVKGLVKITNTSTMPQPKFAYIYFLEDKQNRNSTLGASTSFFLSDGGTPTQFSGTWTTASLPVDKQNFRLIRRIRIRLTQNYAPFSSQTGVVDLQGTQYKEFSFNIPMKGKVLQYDNSGSTTLPNNHNMVWCAGYMNYDGAIDVALQNIVVQINSMMWFKDY